MCSLSNGSPKRPITCISDLYYHLGVGFTAAMVVLTFVTLPLAVARAGENLAVFAFLMCAGLLFVAVAPNYIPGGLERSVHIAGASVAMCAALVLLICCAPHLLTFTFAIGILAIFDTRRWLLWIESAVLVAAVLFVAM